jgi:hypothetical protein
MNFFVIILFLFEVAECSATNIGFCEAKAQCAARGLPIASKNCTTTLAVSATWLHLAPVS